MKDLNTVIENYALPEDLKQTLTEAWEEALLEQKAEIRKELAERYEHDKALLVEAMDKYINETLEKEINTFHTRLKELKDQYNNNLKILEEKLESARSLYEESLKKELKELSEEKKKIAAERVKLSKAMSRAKHVAMKEAEENLQKVAALVEQTLEKEIEDLHAEKKKFVEEKIKLKKKLAETRVQIRETIKDRFFALQDFVLKELENKLSDIVEQRKLLEKRRVELEVKTQKELAEAKKKFVDMSADKIYETIVSVLEAELNQFHEDLKYARENNFGRRIFEAFAAEFMASYLAEGSRIKEMTKQIEKLNENLEHMKQKLLEKEKELREAQKKEAKLLESLERERTLHRLLQPLGKRHRKIMENILKDVKTEKLVETFNRYLPEILRENEQNIHENTKILAENRENPHVFVNITGDKENIEMPAVQEDVMDIDVIRRLAGLK